ncbi:MAG: hypothetical protein ACYS9X_10890, partial [Planctomycetota bacterium]
MSRLGIAAFACVLCSEVVLGSEADDLLNDGAKLLHKVISGDDSLLVPAAKKLTRAAALYAEDGDDEGACRANALLYWTKKRMTLADIAVFRGETDAASAERLDGVTRAVDPAQADEYFRRADEFARGDPDEHLLIAVRFFEVADRFAGTAVSLKAQRRSLAAMQLATKAGPDSTEEVRQPTEVENHPAVIKAMKTFTATVDRAEATFRRRLESAARSERNRGNVAEVERIEAELERLRRSDMARSTVGFEGRAALYGQKSYNSSFRKGAERLQADLTAAAKSELRKEGTAAARAIETYRSEMREKYGPVDVAGVWRQSIKRYTLSPDGTYTLSRTDRKSPKRGNTAGKWSFKDGVLSIHSSQERWDITLDDTMTRSESIRLNGRPMGSAQ